MLRGNTQARTKTLRAIRTHPGFEDIENSFRGLFHAGHTVVQERLDGESKRLQDASKFVRCQEISVDTQETVLAENPEESSSSVKFLEAQFVSRNLRSRPCPCHQTQSQERLGIVFCIV